MSERTEQPPDTGQSSRRTVVRRAVVGGVVGAALLVGPVALANLVVPSEDGSDQVEAADASQTSLINMRRLSNKADTAKAEAAQSLRTTTTTAPPTTTTTVPPTTTTTAPPTTTTTVPPTTTTTAPPPPPEPAPAPAPSGSDFSTWDALAQCEAGGNWSINTGNRYYGGLQFSQSSWQAVGGTGLPHQHSRETQIAMGQRLQAAQGWGAWPACSSKLGLR